MKNRIVSWLSLYAHSGRPAQEAALNDAAYVLLKDIYPVMEIHDELLEALKANLDYFTWYLSVTSEEIIGRESYAAIKNLITQNKEVIATAEGK